jgi:hypothetical protein
VNEKTERFFNSGQCFQHSSPLLLPSDYKVLVRELKEQLIPGFKQFLVTAKLGPHNVRERGSRRAREGGDGSHPQGWIPNHIGAQPLQALFVLSVFHRP